jgi:hypothetical protein
MHPAIKEKLEMMREEKQFNRAEYRVTRDMHRGAKALAAITQPIIDTLTKERDEALARVAELEAKRPAPLEWLPNTGEDPGLPCVAVWFESGLYGGGPSSGWRWRIEGHPGDITRYLPIPAPPRLLVAPDED